VIKLKDKLKLLIELQEFDNRIEDLRKREAQCPLKIEELEHAWQAEQAKAKSVMERLENLNKEKRGIEREIQDLESRIEKSNNKLLNIKSNKEYSAALKEIDDLKKAKFITEDKVIQVMEQIEEVEKEASERKKKEPELRAQYEKSKSQISEELSSLRKELGSLDNKRKELVQLIDQDLLRRYVMIRERRNGIAICPVVNGVCQACHMGIPPQKFNELIKSQDLMTCPNCSRIIYWAQEKDFQQRQSVVS